MTERQYKKIILFSLVNCSFYCKASIKIWPICKGLSKIGMDVKKERVVLCGQRIVLILVGMAMLIGCGQKGPLYWPLPAESSSSNGEKDI